MLSSILTVCVHIVKAIKENLPWCIAQNVTLPPKSMQKDALFNHTMSPRKLRVNICQQSGFDSEVNGLSEKIPENYIHTG